MIRWNEPIEAVHEDGRVVPVTLKSSRNGYEVRPILEEERGPAVAIFQSDGTHKWNRTIYPPHRHVPWRIRNVAQAPETPIDEGKSVNELSGCYKGVIHEMTATIWLMTQGYQVFKNVCPSGPIDLIAIRDTEIIRIDVKTATLKRQADGVMRYNAAFLTQEQESIGVKMLLAHNGVILGWRDDVIDPSRSRRALEKEAGR